MTRHLFLIIGLFGLGTMAGADMTFVHPGALDGKDNLEFVKARVKAKDQPWYGAYTKMLTNSNHTPSPLVKINSNTGDAYTSKVDAKSAYANALAWYISGDSAYARRAIALLNAWTILQGFSSGTEQDKLQAGWIGALFGPAAELMRDYPGWDLADQANLQEMFRRAFYPKLNTASVWNGNVDLTQIDAMLNIAVFNEDEIEFNAGIARLKKRNPAYFYLASDGGVPAINGDGGSVDAFWSNPANWVDGLTQETCRINNGVPDNDHHAQYAMASALHAAEVAWHQGVDVYTINTQRYTAVMELMATQIVTGSMQQTCDNDSTTHDRFDTWEIGYNHYHHRKGIDLPNTLQALLQEVRPKGQSDWNIFYETLTHADVDSISPISILPNHHSPKKITLSYSNSGFCKIHSEKSVLANLSVMSLNGKRWSQSSMELIAGQNQSISLGLEGAPAGIYLVQLSSELGNQVLRLVQ